MLGQLGENITSECINALINALSDPNPETKLAVILALIQIGDYIPLEISVSLTKFLSGIDIGARLKITFAFGWALQQSKQHNKFTSEFLNAAIRTLGNDMKNMRNEIQLMARYQLFLLALFDAEKQLGTDIDIDEDLLSEIGKYVEQEEEEYSYFILFPVILLDRVSLDDLGALLNDNELKVAKSIYESNKILSDMEFLIDYLT